MTISIVFVSIIFVSGMITDCVSGVDTTADGFHLGLGLMERSTSKESLQELFKRLSNSDSRSLLKKYLTADVFNRVKSYKTRYDGTLADCIRPGCMNPESECGIYASDPEAYDAFSDVFYPIIRSYHKIEDLKQPNPNFGHLSKINYDDLDPDGRLIVSNRISVRRSLAKFGFPPTTTKENRTAMEGMTLNALKKLRGHLTGTYYPLIGMDQEAYKDMAEVFPVKQNDPEKHDAEIYKDWPKGRGVFCNHEKKFYVLINGEDHLHIVSMQTGGNLATTYITLVEGLKSLERTLDFVHHPTMGFLTYSPTNIGTSLRIRVRIRIPNLSKDLHTFKHLCEKLNLRQESIADEVFDISNKRLMGLTEKQIFEDVRSGIKFIIVEERRLSYTN